MYGKSLKYTQSSFPYKVRNSFAKMQKVSFVKFCSVSTYSMSFKYNTILQASMSLIKFDGLI